MAKQIRLSLTAKQLETAAGIDLLALCERITSDGSITLEEGAQLREWLETNASIDMPSIRFLRGTVQRILADGQITSEELKELHLAVERVLPPHYRDVSRALRKEFEKAAKAKKRPLAQLDSMVAGITFEGRAYVVNRHARAGDRVFLVRDPNNRYSKTAIEVRLANGMSIGWVPDEKSKELAPLFDNGALHIAYIKKIWPGRKVDVPIIWAQLFAADSGVEGAVAQKDCPPKVAAPISHQLLAGSVMRNRQRLALVIREERGCVVLLIIALSVLVIVASVTTS